MTNCQKKTKQNKIWCCRYVEYKTVQEAMSAMECAPDGLNNFAIAGGKLSVQFALTAEERERRDQRKRVMLPRGVLICLSNG